MDSDQITRPMETQIMKSNELALTYRDKIEQLEHRLANMKVQRDTEAAIVNRIWHIFQSPTYQQLRGASLYDLVEEALSMAVSAYRKEDMETIPRQGRPEVLEMDEYYRIVIREIISTRGNSR